MKLIIKYFLLFIVILFGSCSKKTININHESLKITISTDKKMYIKGEPVWLSINIKNTGKTDYKFISKKLWFLLADNKIKIHLIDSDNIQYNYSGGLLDYSWSGKYELLKPGEEFQEVFNISEYFGTPYWKWMKGGLNYFNPNYYSLFTVLHRKTISNQIIFQVIETNDMSQKAFELFMQGYNERDYLLRKQIYRKIINSFPESPYLENALYQSTIGFRTAGDNEYRKIVDLCFEFIDKFPESGYLRKVIRKIPNVYSNLEEFDKIDSTYNKLLELYKETNPNIVKIVSEEFESYTNHLNN